MARKRHKPDEIVTKLRQVEVKRGQPMFDAVRLADHVEAHLLTPSGVTVALLLGERDAVLREIDSLDRFLILRTRTVDRNM